MYKRQNKEYLNVNELATLFGLNVQTLHYYDKIGILKPSYRDPVSYTHLDVYKRQGVY